jgi:hypothetical protein
MTNPTDHERRSGHSKLVYDKDKRAIVTVQDAALPPDSRIAELEILDAANSALTRQLSEQGHRIAELEAENARLIGILGFVDSANKIAVSGTAAPRIARKWPRCNHDGFEVDNAGCAACRLEKVQLLQSQVATLRAALEWIGAAHTDLNHVVFRNNAKIIAHETLASLDFDPKGEI